MSESEIIKFIGLEEIKNAISLSFVTETINDYIIYGKYQLNKSEYGCTITRLSDDDKMTFGLMKTAVLYCMLDYSNNVRLANKIHIIDGKITALITEIIINRAKIKTTKNIESNGIAHAKLTENELKLSELQYELKKIESLAKIWQDQRLSKRKNEHFKNHG